MKKLLLLGAILFFINGFSQITNHSNPVKLDGIQEGTEIDSILVKESDSQMKFIRYLDFITKIQGDITGVGSSFNPVITSPINGEILVFDGTNWVNQSQGSGTGDMLKSIYDTNDDDVVDNSATLGGQIPAYYLDYDNFTNVNYRGVFADLTAISNDFTNWDDEDYGYNVADESIYINDNGTGVIITGISAQNIIDINQNGIGVAALQVQQNINTNDIATNTLGVSNNLGIISAIGADVNTLETGKENSLGNPSTSGYVLSSLTDGTRSWIANGTGSSDGNDFVTSGLVTGTDLTLTIPNQTPVTVDMSSLGGGSSYTASTPLAIDGSNNITFDGSGYLPTTGGTITGTLTSTVTGLGLDFSTNNGYIAGVTRLYGGSSGVQTVRFNPLDTEFYKSIHASSTLVNLGNDSTKRFGYIYATNGNYTGTITASDATLDTELTTKGQMDAAISGAGIDLTADYNWSGTHDFGYKGIKFGAFGRSRIATSQSSNAVRIYSDFNDDFNDFPDMYVGGGSTIFGVDDINPYILKFRGGSFFENAISTPFSFRINGTYVGTIEPDGVYTSIATNADIGTNGATSLITKGYADATYGGGGSIDLAADYDWSGIHKFGFNGITLGTTNESQIYGHATLNEIALKPNIATYGGIRLTSNQMRLNADASNQYDIMVEAQALNFNILGSSWINFQSSGTTKANINNEGVMSTVATNAELIARGDGSLTTIRYNDNAYAMKEYYSSTTPAASIALNNTSGVIVYIPQTLTAYTTFNVVQGGRAIVIVDTSGMTDYPTLNGLAPTIQSPAFVAGEHTMVIYSYDGINVNHFFTKN